MVFFSILLPFTKTILVRGNMSRDLANLAYMQSDGYPDLTNAEPPKADSASIAPSLRKDASRRATATIHEAIKAELLALAQQQRG